MAEYYDMQEVVSKLRKTEEEVQELVKQGRLQQYMDSGKPVFKTEDVDSLAEEIVGLDVSSMGLAPGGSGDTEIKLEETAEIQLEPDEEEAPGGSDLELDIKPDAPESEGGFGLSQMGDLTMGDTNVGTVGINILSGTGDAYQLAEDTKAETSADEIEELESLDGDSNMESFGSGSGLLDLSLQADDTSLGAVLDDILPAGTEEGGAGGADFPVEEVGLVEEAEDLLAEGEPASAAEAMATMEPAPVAVAATPMAAVAVESGTGVFGVLMFLPLVVLVLAAIILTAAINNVVPALMKPLITRDIAGISLTWMIAGGLIVLLLLILMVASLAGGGGTKTKGAKKQKKAKPAKKKRK